MMADLRIERLHKRYRLPANALDARLRLDRVLQSAIDGELLDSALERARIPSTDHICIRRVDSIVRLDRARTDSGLAVAWSVALAAAIGSRLDEGGPDVVRYRDRYIALVDMVCAASRGDLDRAWAWRALRIWPPGDAFDAQTARLKAIEGLTREPRLAPAVLGAVARSGLLSLLVSSIPEERWVALACASLRDQASSDVTILDLLFEAGPSEHQVDESKTIVAVVGVERIDRLSAIMHSVLGTAVVKGERTSTALAVLALLECEPGLAASPYAPAIVNGLARRLAGGAESSGRPRADHQRSSKSVSYPRAATKHPQADAQDPDAEVLDTSTSDDRACGTTAFGGLLFLLHVVRGLDLPTVLAHDPTLATRSLQWTLHGLALLLAPIDDNDAAALAFAGLAPGSQAPTKHESPPNESEDRTLHATRDAIVAALYSRMRAAIDETDALLLHLTSRRAEIIATPAWIELRFHAAEVSTDVRRAGLDLDLGWLPWLGAVVRFSYV